MEKSGFFNSVSGDRKYKAEDWANYFKRLVTNGIFPVPSTNLQVMANSDMTITVKAGAAWINGYTYENTSELILPVDAADGVLSRIDRVVLKYDTVGREIKAIVKKGSFASSPVAPVLQRDADAYELGLADISIVAGAASIEQVSVTDIRLNTELCGIVNSLIQADTTTLLNQYESGMQAKMLEFQADFETWFATVQDILDESTAGNLLNLINAQAAALGDHEEAADPHDQYALDSELSTLQDEVSTHKADNAAHGEIANVYRSGKDANGIFVTLEYKRTNGTLFKKSILSGGTSPKYTTRTVTYYDTNGTTVLVTKVYTLTYTGDDLTSEVTTA